MARPSKKGGKTGVAKRRKASLERAPASANAKRRGAPAASRSKRPGGVGLIKELREAREQQAATAEILKVIARSPEDVQPVFEAIVGNAVRLIGGFSAAVYRFVDDRVHLTAITSVNAAADERLRASFPRAIGDDHFRRAQAGEVVAIADTEDQPNAVLKEVARARGFRSVLYVPLKNSAISIGVITVNRQAAGPFAAHHVELLKTLADQAVIAIENVKLFDEVQAKTRDLEESLQQQTATADVLKVISRSAFDLQRVLDTLTESAVRLCGADHGYLFRLQDGLHHLAASFGVDQQFKEFLISNPFRVDRGTLSGRVAIDGGVVHIDDAANDPEYTWSEAQQRGNLRTGLGVPLVREGGVIGIVVLYRSRVERFTERQISLVATFADQAVIAIENARLFEEVQAKTRDLAESLRFQTASSDVLKVISRSPDALQPVLDAIIETSRQLCGSATSIIFLVRDGKFHVAAESNAAADRLAYMRANPIAFDQRGSAMARAARQRRTVHVPNTADDPEFDQAGPLGVGVTRALLAVPLMRDGEVIGGIALTQPHTNPFTTRQIEAVETFADQAVIAIENARLFNETKEALERQTATSDILNVIASSPTDTRPVFDAIASRAKSLVGGFSSTVFRFTDGMAYLEAFTPTTLDADEFLKSTFPRPVADFAPFRMTQSGEVMQIPDIEALTDEIKDIGRARGFRSMLFAPLVNKGVSIGFIAVTRVEPGKFAEQHVQLLRTFADQAVIAIGNVRLFDEVQTRTRELASSLEELRAAQDRLVQSEKLASLGQLTAGIAHEIKNPLNFVNNFSALSAELVDEMTDVLADAGIEGKKREELDEIRELLKNNLEKVVQHGKRADSIVKNMLLHSRAGSGESRSVEINTIVDESLNLAYHGARAEKQGFNITLHRNLDPKAGQVDVYPQEMTRVLLNLISNGFYAATKRKSEAEGGFEPALSASTKDLGDKVEIRIRDNGTGIPADVKAKMFNPFFTTKPAGEGTGLGLSMSHDIVVKQHRGTIDVVTEPGVFTEFIITLPRTTSAQETTGRTN